MASANNWVWMRVESATAMLMKSILFSSGRMTPPLIHSVEQQRT
jgi:hypothetical protein